MPSSKTETTDMSILPIGAGKKSSLTTEVTDSNLNQVKLFRKNPLTAKFLKSIMSKIKIPDHLLSKLFTGMSMGFHLVDVQLNDGRQFKDLVVIDGLFITGTKYDLCGEGELAFTDSDIYELQCHSYIVGSQWPTVGPVT